MEYFFQAYCRFLIILWLFLWLIGLLRGKVALLLLQRHVSTWTKSSLSFELFCKYHEVQACAHFKNVHQFSCLSASEHGSRGTAGGGLLEPTWRMAAVREDARGSGFLWAAGRYSMPGATLRARHHSHLYVQKSGRFPLGELHFLKSKQLREAEKRICNIRLK